MLDTLRPIVGLIVRSPLPLAALIWALLAVARAPGGALLDRARRAGPLLPLAAALSFVLYAGIILVGQPGFDHVAVQVVNASRLLLDGAELYHPLDAPRRWALLYGPLPYLIDAALLRVAPGTGLTAVELAPIAAFIGGLLLTGAALLRSPALASPDGDGSAPGGSAGRRAVGGLVALVALLALAFGSVVLEPHPDAWLFLLAAAGLALAARGRGASASGLGLGALAGAAAGCKLHGLLYLAPAAALLWARRGMRPLGFAGLAAPLVLGAPFLHPGIDLGGYRAILGTSLRHGLDAYELHMAAGVAAAWLVPALLAPAPGRALARAERALVAGLLVAVPVVTIVAGKAGAGPHHLVPFLPALVAAWRAQARRVAGGWGGATPARARLALAWGLSIGVWLAAGHFLALRSLPPGLGRAEASELLALRERLGAGPVQVGLGERWRAANLSPLLVLRGEPYWFDPAALADFARAGLPLPPASRELFRSCSTRHWLIAHGESPFAARSLYPPHPLLFDESFREAFLESHSRTLEGEHWDVWSCVSR